MQPLVIIAGPTAVGKTALSLDLARKINGEIISADSMQVYRQRDIGTAKLKKSEMQGIPHYMIDILEPSEDFNVALFQKMAKACVFGINERGHIPIVVGGTGFYIQALLYDIDFREHDSDESYRQELEALASENLHSLLEKIDPEAALQIHPHNKKRLIRALEFHQQTNQQISQHNEAEKKRESPYNFVYFVLNDERARIYRGIEQRVDAMVEAGLEDEVRRLQELGLTKADVSMQGLGYKQMLSYLAGEITCDEAIKLIKRDTRHFAKRQLTWLRRESQRCEIIWLDRQDFADEGAILAEMAKRVEAKGIEGL
jgi:tRNA dimethylallyltransferase